MKAARSPGITGAIPEKMQPPETVKTGNARPDPLLRNKCKDFIPFCDILSTKSA
jgi:hypothetical protein